jgi:hypothetical protein
MNKIRVQLAVLIVAFSLTAASTIMCKNDALGLNGNPHSKELRLVKSGCQLHLYPCGTCSVGGGPGSILIREDCSQSCEKCGN